MGTGSNPGVNTKNLTGLEPRWGFKLPHSSHFLSKLLGRNAGNVFNSFKFELSARIFKKRRQENLKLQRKTVILDKNSKIMIF